MYEQIPQEHWDHFVYPHLVLEGYLAFSCYWLLRSPSFKPLVKKQATPSAGCRFRSCFATHGLQLDNQMSRWIKGLVMGQRRAERDSTVNMLHIMQSSEAGEQRGRLRASNPPVYLHACTVDVSSQAQLLEEILNTRAVTGAADSRVWQLKKLLTVGPAELQPLQISRLVRRNHGPKPQEKQFAWYLLEQFATE